ncbi:SDR family oxidoreductase [Microbacterium aquimaris]|uniref:SDR family oxidoreductase n=1 Tax=Microbacterium aquimaris TaxID=459816 RepID=A0ABU5N9S3_9MICO|nr:SDR family oxidoreductase [Microbacterium aquimaris]MDZ8162801.1 SDR family oxidoreductase [Microbacterium aquimaris]
MTTRILLIGGHGKVALLTEPLLVDAGHHVTAVIRNPDHEADVRSTGATPLLADVQSFDDEQMRNLVSGNDVVIWAAGAGGGDAERTYAVDRDAAIRSMDAAVAAGARRYVMVSYFGAGPDHGVPEDHAFFAYAEAKSAADEHLRGAELDWTILAPSALTLDDGTGMIDAAAEEAGSVPRADVAGVIAASLADDSTIGRTIRFNSGTTPIAEAIGG